MKYFCCFLVLITGCVAAPLSEWRIYDAGPFSFSLPKNMEKTSLEGNDSYAAAFKSANCYLDFDYGVYGAADTKKMYPNASDFVSMKEEINGREADIASFETAQLINGCHYLISVYFPGRGLKMFVSCKYERDFSVGLKIFRSVKFK